MLNSAPIPLSILPTFTFINGPNGSGKTSLANALGDLDHGLCHSSFADPIRSALLATFYPDEMYSGGLDLQSQKVKSSPLFDTGLTHREWMIQYAQWMRSATNPYIFATIALRRCERLARHWPRFIFDDCRYPQEPAPFSLAYGPTECLIISLRRNGCSFTNPNEVGEDLMLLPGARHIALNNNGPTIHDAVGVLLGTTRTTLSPQSPRSGGTPSPLPALDDQL